MPDRIVCVMGVATFLLSFASLQAWGYLASPQVQGFIPDARPAGMGRAFTAVAEGPAGVWWNPGSLGLVHGWWAMPFSALPMSSYSEGSHRFGSYGVCGKIRRVGVATHFSRLKFERERQADYTESSMILGCGVDLMELIRREPDPRFQWGVGASIKRNSIHAPDALNPEWKDLSAWDIDVGTVARIERSLHGLPILPIAATRDSFQSSYVAGRFGFMFKNLLDQKIGPGDDPMGQEIRLGLGFETGLIPTPPFSHLLRALVTVEVEDSLTEEDLSSNLKYGLEATLVGIVTYRYGEFDDHHRFWVGTEDGVRVVQRNDRWVTHGVGLRFGGEHLALHFDYAKVYRKHYSLSVHVVP